MGIGGRMENGSEDSCMSVFDDEEKTGGYRVYSSSSHSSIGKNSDEDVENEIDHGEEEEVQSSYNKELYGSFHSLQAIGESLPDNKGMSQYYHGKSKSYTSLADASACSSISEISKPLNVYEQRRKNSLAKKLDKNHSSQLKSSGGVLKKSKLSTTRRCTLALAVAMTNSDTIENQDPAPYSSLSPHYSQIRHPKFNSSCSASFADLEQRASLGTSASL